MAKDLELTTDQPCLLSVYHTDNQGTNPNLESFDPTPRDPSHELEYGYKSLFNGVTSDVGSHYLYFKPDAGGSTTHKVKVPDDAQGFTLERTTPGPRTTTEDMTQVIDTTTSNYAGVYLWCSTDPNYRR